MPDLESVATELYALLPAEFTAARNERAKQLGGELGKKVKALPKPSSPAWATNLLARSKPAEMAQLLALGASLRDAQDDLDRVTLTKLGKQRRALVSALAKEAASLAREAGQAINPAAVVDVERTLQAAMSDASAASAVSSARLVRALSADGVEDVDLEGAVAGQPAAPVLRAVDPSPIDLAKARRALESAEDALRSAARAVRDAVDDRASLESERDDLREQLADIEGELLDTSRAVERTEKERKKAARAVDRARATLDD